MQNSNTNPEVPKTTPELDELMPPVPEIAEILPEAPDLAEIERLQDEALRDIEQARREAEERLDDLLSLVAIHRQEAPRRFHKYLRSAWAEAVERTTAAEATLAVMVDDMAQEWDAGLPVSRQLSPKAVEFLGLSLERVEAERELMELELLLLHLEPALQGKEYTPEVLRGHTARFWFQVWLDEEESRDKAPETSSAWPVREGVGFHA